MCLGEHGLLTGCLTVTSLEIRLSAAIDQNAVTIRVQGNYLSTVVGIAKNRSRFNFEAVGLIEAK